ncbi:uncharacterized protein LOC108734416 [Agrilus planipennis]|uniref:Uncharacterized protein LOC108734416 n=1 Tax=Agrilus planipennis TaxID=224129 RepID=A0A7F5R0G8_AGRPL|nr:uncharacterized protein LOC108734416 [Agrilus planipennis]
MAPKGQNEDSPVFSTSECKRFIVDCLEAVGTIPEHAKAHADLLVDADYRGHYSHGMNRLENYINDVIRKSCDPNATPKILKENAATAWVDGCNGLGSVVGNYCMDLAIKKAKEVGVGWVVCKGMYYQIEMLIRKNKPIPEGWALDSNSNPTTDAQAAFSAGRLLPLGGSEDRSGYKGYGLGTMIEMFTGIMSGGTYGPYVRNWSIATKEEPCNLSQCFVAIDPENFAPLFNDRLQDLMDYLRNLEPLDKSKPVLVAGDPERIHMASVDKAGGITYIQNQIDNCNKIAKELNVKPLQPVA